MKNSFVLYTDYIDQIELLNMNQRGVLLTAMMMYVSGEPLPEMDGMTMMAFSFIKAQIDRDSDKYDKTVEARREAGRKGGKAKQANANIANQNKAKLANASIAKQTETKQADNVNDNDNVNVNDKNNIYTAAFEKMWSVYPRRKEKQKAWKCYKARLAEGSSEDALFTAVKRYADECRVKNTAEEYIKHAATFFSKDRPFEDYLGEEYKPPMRNAGTKDMNNFERRNYDMDSLEQSLLCRK